MNFWMQLFFTTLMLKNLIAESWLFLTVVDPSLFYPRGLINRSSLILNLKLDIFSAKME